MRTTVRLDDNLLRQAKRFAAATGRSLTSLIEDSLRQTMQMRPSSRSRRRICLTTSPGALRPGVNVDSSAELLDLMEDHT